MLLMRRVPEALLIRHLLSINVASILIISDDRGGEMTWAMVAGMKNTLGSVSCTAWDHKSFMDISRGRVPR